MVKFELINPVIEGSNITTSFDTDSPENAAKELWDVFTQKKLFLYSVPALAFTLQEGGEKLHHFLAKETVNSDKTIAFSIENITESVNKNTSVSDRKKLIEGASQYKNKIKTEMSGGGKDDDDDDKKKKKKKKDSSSSSSDDLDDPDDYIRYIYKKRALYQTPLFHWIYNRQFYPSYRNLFVPVFKPTVYPIVQLWVPT